MLYDRKYIDTVADIVCDALEIRSPLTVKQLCKTIFPLSGIPVRPYITDKCGSLNAPCMKLSQEREGNVQIRRQSVIRKTQHR